jgi:methylenetetrahydrofolate dehydrogenase (NADP+)/methenyltetrahydrofolate cyclohydrolase
MAAQILDGDALAARWREEMRRECVALAAQGVTPRLATILVGDDAASTRYVQRKHDDCEEIGIASESVLLPATTSEVELLAAIAQFNSDVATNGLLVQLPLPSHINAAHVVSTIDPTKDVDGLHPLNLGALMQGLPALRPCTPQAIIYLLRAYRIALAGRSVAIIGRGALVGRPLSIMLADNAVNAAPLLLHRGVPDLRAYTRLCDIIVSAAGAADLIRADMVKPGAAVVGVGITYRDGAMISDIAEDVADVASFVTPPHGSVGPLTRAALMSNTIAAARAQCAF